MIVIFLAIDHFANFLIILIIARALLSWFPQPSSDSPLGPLYYGFLKFAHVLTDPITAPIRKLIQRSPLGGPGMMIDFSPMIAMILINFARQILLNFLINIAA
ncbi:MAG: YggT family protein [Turicibacter sp.]|nr:YggT family protein [Turicibacter sp.]